MTQRAFKRAAVAVLTILVAAAGTVSIAAAQAPQKLLITQVETRGSATSSTQTEYVVVKNPGTTSVDLSHYYLTDATFANGNQYYYNLPDAALPIGGGGFNDFVARFPDGATLAAGAEASVAINGSTAFTTIYGVAPTYELYEDGTAADGVPDMAPARDGSILAPGQATAQYPSLTNSGEVVILFYWDGASDLVTDVDYLVWGDKDEAVDKTGISIDGPDADSTPTAYLADTAITSQDAQLTNPTGTFIRVDANEGTQKTSGGNGVAGRDETSENVSATFSNNTDGVPPGSAPVDTTPPTLVSASALPSMTEVSVLFSEPVATGALTAANYAVYPTANPGSPITVSSVVAAANPAAVQLVLGATLANSTGYTVRVSNVQDTAGNPIAANSTTTFTTGGSAGEFAVAGVFRFGPKHIAVAFSDKVNTGQATTTSNYTVLAGASGVTPSGAAVQDNGQTVILTFASDLAKSTTYSVSVSGVTSTGGSSLAGGGPFTFATGSETVIGIADLQNNVSTYTGQSITIIGQVFVPVIVQTTTVTGYIQDGTGRGVNLFLSGTTPQSAVDAVDKVVKVTGTVATYFTTVEITPFTPTLLAQGMPPLGPKTVTIPEANSSQWEGTYIRTSGTITVAPTPSGSSNNNIEATGDGGNITFRVRNSTGINFSDFHVGDTVTGAGAGGAFQSTFQINIGLASDFVKGGVTDTTPPTILSAGGADASSSLSVVFSEALGSGATTASNYTVFPSGSPSSTIAVNSASLSGSTVTLSLGTALVGGTAYTVQVRNVQDLAGNAIASGAAVTFTASGGGTGGFAVVGIFQFGPAHIGVAFGAPVNSDQAVVLSNYAITPSGGAAAVSLKSATLQENGQTVILQTTANLPLNGSYNVAVSGVTSRAGDALQGGGPTSFTTSPTQVTGIADIHANLSTFNGKSVTVICQVFYPVGVVLTSTGSQQISGWGQDGTGRGVNLFDFTGNVPAAVNAVGKVVRATGTLSVFNTTVELTNFSATLLAENQPALGPKVLTVAQANSSDWEGTYIQTSATLTGTPAASGASHYNVNAEDGGSVITFRIRDGRGINVSSFKAGDRVIGAGAGGAFQTTFQINVGLAADFRLAGTGPPTLIGAGGDAGSDVVRVSFSKELDPVSAATAANYKVFPTGQPEAGFSVLSAGFSGTSKSIVSLKLGSALGLGTQYTVEVSNVKDTTGETIAAASRTTFTAREAALVKVRVTVPPATLVRGLNGVGELFPVKVEGEAGSRIVCRIVDLQGRVVRNLGDEFLPTTSQSGNQPSVEYSWDGRDESYEFVPTGMYVCHVLATDLNGKTTTDQAPIVVSVRLD